MEDHERAYLEAVTENLSASIASGMRALADESLFEDEEHLTADGRLWAQGFLTGRLTLLRCGSTGNPNLSGEDFEAVAAVVEHNEASIAAQLYG